MSEPAEEKGGEKAEKAEKPSRGAPPNPKLWERASFDHDLEALAKRLSAPAGPCAAGDLKIVPWGPKQVEGYVEFPAEKVVSVCRTLRDDSECRYDVCLCVSAVDYAKEDPRIAVVYHLLSVEKNRRAQVRAWVPREKSELDSVSTIWAAAEWHERETYDLMGVVFRNHPDLRRILCPEDWVGFPLRKDYEFPKEYHGISCV